MLTLQTDLQILASFCGYGSVGGREFDSPTMTFFCGWFQMEHSTQEQIQANHIAVVFRGSVYGRKCASMCNYCREGLANEVEALMDMDQLCNLKKAQEGEDEAEGDDGGSDAAEAPKKSCDSESVNALAAKLKALSVEVDNLGDEFSAIAVAVNDASDNVRSAYRRIKSTKQKKRNHSRQSQIGAFMKNK